MSVLHGKHTSLCCAPPLHQTWALFLNGTTQMNTYLGLCMQTYPALPSLYNAKQHPAQEYNTKSMRVLIPTAKISQKQTPLLAQVTRSS